MLSLGNFLRVNPIAARLLSYAMTFWSKGTKKAIFLMHEVRFHFVNSVLQALVWLFKYKIFKF